MFKKLSKAFSMVDAIIILSVVAIAIAVATPMLTRKVVNIDEPGGLTGNGRYEFYYKEVVSYGNGWFEKAIGDGNNEIAVYERKTDSEYFDITGNAAKADSNGNKDTLYEEINATPDYDANGNVAFITYAGKKHPVGGRYIIENKNLVYYPFNVNGNNPHRTSNTPTYPNSNYRIIEGMLTKKYTGKANHWIINITNSSHYSGEVKTFPFEKIYTTETPNPIERYVPSGEASFNPGEDVKNVTIHAVGAGGAGGGIDENKIGKAISPKGATSLQIKAMQKHLAEEFRQGVRALKPAADGNSFDPNKPLYVNNMSNGNVADFRTYADGTDEAIVGVCNGCSKNNRDANPLFTNENMWLLIDTADGTLNGKLDFQKGFILPHEVMNYNIALGNNMQLPDYRDMPEILSEVYPPSPGIVDKDKFHMGIASPPGKNGGNGSSAVWSVSSSDDHIVKRCILRCTATANKNAPSNTGYNNFRCDEYFSKRGRTATTTCNSPKRCSQPVENKQETTTPSTPSTPSKPSTPKKPGNDIVPKMLDRAAKIDYSQELKFESVIDKIRSFLNKDEIDSRYPIAHAAGDICYGGFENLDTTYGSGSCSNYYCYCPDGKTSGSCASGSKTTYNTTTTYELNKTGSDFCVRGTCKPLICNSAYFTCENQKESEAANGATANTKCPTNESDAFDCPGINPAATGAAYTHTMKGGSGGKGADSVIACVTPQIGQVYSFNRGGGVKAGSSGSPCTFEGVDGTHDCTSPSYRDGTTGDAGWASIVNVATGENVTAVALGGTGGKACNIPRVTVTLDDIVDPEAQAEARKWMNELQKYFNNTYGFNTFEIESANGNLGSMIAEYSTIDPEGYAKYAEMEAVTKAFYSALQTEAKGLVIEGEEEYSFDEASATAFKEKVLEEAGTYEENYKQSINEMFDGQKKYYEIQKGKSVNDTYLASLEAAVASAYNAVMVSLNANFVPPEAKTDDAVKSTGQKYEFVKHINVYCDRLALGCENSNCGASGVKGKQTGNICPEDKRKGIGTDGKIYNHIYSWSVPYRYNSLLYSQAGEVGEYKSTKVPKITGPIEITLGRGGVWSGTNWKNANTKGQDGGNTVVRMNDKNILTAKGGKGGKSVTQTSAYDLCIANNSGTCYENTKLKALDATKVSCCHGESGTHSTRDIIMTAIKYSTFENIKSLTGSSKIVGLGLGRGAEPAGTRSNHEQTYGEVYFTNISASGSYTGSRKITASAKSAAGSTAETNYKNIPIKPSALNFKGGDGAVIITW